MRNRFRFLLLATAVGLSASGCGKREAGPPDGAAVTPAPAIADKVGPALTEDDYREFGKQLQAAITAGDQDAVDRLYRFDELLERSVRDLDVSPAFREGFMAGLKKSQASQWSQQLIALVQRGGKFNFLRVRTEDGSPRAVFRIIIPNGGMNYQLLTLARRQDGSIAAEDIHVMLTGEKISQTMRRIILNFAAEKDRGFLAKVRGPERLFADNVATLQAMGLAIRQGRNKDAFNAYKQLPAELQKDKTLQMMGLVAAQGVSNDEYVAMMESYRRNHPNDPTIDMVSIDYFLLKQQYDESLRCVERLSQAIGGDPYLQALSGNVLSEAGRFPEARATCEKAIELEPTLEEAYWCRITVSLREKNHSDTNYWLRKIVTQCNAPLDVEALRNNPDYDLFVKSNEYEPLRKWQQARQK